MADKKEEFREYDAGGENWEGLPAPPRISKGEPPKVDWKQIASALEAPEQPTDAGDNFIGAVVDDVVRDSLLTPQQKVREERAARLDRAGFVEVDGTLMSKTQAKSLRIEDDDVIGRMVRNFNPDAPDVDIDALDDDDEW